MDDIPAKYAPDALFACFAAAVGWMVRRYAVKVDRIAEQAATRRDVAAVEDRGMRRLAEAEARFKSEIVLMRQEQSDRYDRLEQRVGDGFRGLNDRLDRWVDRVGERHIGS